MTPSVISPSADHVTLHPQPSSCPRPPQVTWYPCPPFTLPVTTRGCCSRSGLLLSSSPSIVILPSCNPHPHSCPCFCRVQTTATTSLPFSLPTPSSPADEVNRHCCEGCCCCGQDRPDDVALLNDPCIAKNHMNDLNCCCDDGDDDAGAAATLLGSQSAPGTMEDLCSGHVKNSRSGELHKNHQGLSCDINADHSLCSSSPTPSLDGGGPCLRCCSCGGGGSSSSSSSSKGLGRCVCDDVSNHGNDGVTSCGCVSQQQQCRHHHLANQTCQIFGAHSSDSRRGVVVLTTTTTTTTTTTATTIAEQTSSDRDSIQSNSLFVDDMPSNRPLTHKPDNDSHDSPTDKDSVLDHLAARDNPTEVVPAHLHCPLDTPLDRLNNLVTHNQYHRGNDDVLKYPDKLDTCGCDSTATAHVRRLWSKVGISSRSGSQRDSREAVAVHSDLQLLPPTGGAARVLVEGWCQAWSALPAVLVLWLMVLLLLPLRRNIRRRDVVFEVPHVLLILCLLITHCLASPWIEESGHSVKLRAQFCQPVPDEHLRNILGTAFDPERMSNDAPFNGVGGGGGGKRSDPSLDPRTEDAALESYFYYGGDGPHSGEDEDEDEAFAKDHEEEEEEEEEDGWMREEMKRRRTAGRGEVVKKEDILEEEEEEEEEEEDKEEGQFDPQKDRGGKSFYPNQSPKDAPYYYHHQSYLNMKRRKRDVDGGGGDGGGDDTDFASASSSSYSSSSSSGGEADDSNLQSPRDKKSRDSPLHLRLLLSGRNRKLRRKLKKEFRKKARRLGRKPPPWTCAISKVWGRLKEGFFPRYLLDGRCLTDKCFYRLYDCVPQRYRIKLLKRDPDYCNPLPALGANSTYEQKWSVVRYYVTVGCSCQAADPLQMPLPFQGQIRRT